MIPDEYLINEKFNVGGAIIEVHDSRILPSFIAINDKFNKEKDDFHNLLMSKGVKAYRCNDGWVDREDRKVTFFHDDKDTGYYWSDKSLDVGDLIFIGNMNDGGRFAKIVKCEKIWEHNYGWSRKYQYKPLNKILDGNERPYITINTLTKKQKILRSLGLFDENKILTDIFE